MGVVSISRFEVGFDHLVIVEISMNNTVIKVFYWAAFALSLFILPLNFGLGLVAFAIIILPILILHFLLGLNLGKLKKYKLLVVVAACNLLAFALVRPDGVHTITDNGLSAFLDLFGIHAGFSDENESLYFMASFALLIVQLAVDITLWSLKNKAARKQLA